MRKYIIILICVSFIFMVSCGSPAENNTDAAGNNAADNAVGGANEANESDGSGNNGEKNQDIFGAISEIIGNMATINLAVMPETGMPFPMERRSFDPENLPEGVVIGEDGKVTFDPENLPDGVTLNEDGSIAVNREMIQGAGGGPVTFGDGQAFDASNMGDGEVRMFNAGDSGFTGADRGEGGGQGMRGAMGGMLLDYTGEEKEFIIPVGVPIYAITRGEDGEEVETEIELTDIQTGNAISVAYKEDGKTIDKIKLSQITALKPSEVEEMRDMMNNIQIVDNTNNTENADETGGENEDGE